MNSGGFKALKHSTFKRGTAEVGKNRLSSSANKILSGCVKRRRLMDGKRGRMNRRRTHTRTAGRDGGWGVVGRRLEGLLTVSLSAHRRTESERAIHHSTHSGGRRRLDFSGARRPHTRRLSGSVARSTSHGCQDPSSAEASVQLQCGPTSTTSNGEVPGREHLHMYRVPDLPHPIDVRPKKTESESKRVNGGEALFGTRHAVCFVVSCRILQRWLCTPTIGSRMSNAGQRHVQLSSRRIAQDKEERQHRAQKIRSSALGIEKFHFHRNIRLYTAKHRDFKKSLFLKAQLRSSSSTIHGWRQLNGSSFTPK